MRRSRGELPLSIAGLMLVLALVVAAAEARSSVVTLRLTDARTGYISARLEGHPGASVLLVEDNGSGMLPLVRVTIPRSGRISVPALLHWKCAPRTRTVIARVAGVTAAQATVTTPGCADRLFTHIGRDAGPGGALTVVLKDRWGIGGLPVKLCVQPPGGRMGCQPEGLPAGVDRKTVQVPVPRPGGWALLIKDGYGRPNGRTVWVERPGDRIRLLAAGDSEMQILDDDIGEDLAPHAVGTTSDARISTGLTNEFFYDWQAGARQEAASVSPDVTVVFMGANDGFSTKLPGKAAVPCCGPQWSLGYANLVAEMMRTLLRGNAGRVYWFLLPAPRPANFQNLFNGVNRGIVEAAAGFPGRVAVIDANAFFTPGNRYRDYMTVDGHGFTIHEVDGVHLSASADVYAAQLVVARMKADRIIR